MSNLTQSFDESVILQFSNFYITNLQVKESAFFKNLKVQLHNRYTLRNCFYRPKGD